MPSVSEWQYSGPGQVSVKADKDPQKVSLNYSLSGPKVYNVQTWKFSTTAKETGKITYNWNYNGFHAWFKPYRKISVVVNKPDGTTETATLMEGSLRGTVNADGEESFEVYKGLEYSFIIQGKNFDRDSRLFGTLTVETSGVSDWEVSGNGDASIKPGEEKKSLDFSYSLEGKDVHELQTWKFSTTAKETKEIMYYWKYDGFHAWYKPYRKIYVEVNKPGGGTEIELITEDTNRGPSEAKGFNSFKIYEGQDYSFVIQGKNYDSDMRLYGTLNVVEIPNPLSWKHSGKGEVTIAHGENKRSLDFGYSLSGSEVHCLQTWKYYTTATETETIDYVWEYNGFHAWYQPYLKISAIVHKPDGTTDSTTLDEGSHRGDYYKKGTLSIEVYEGHEYSFEIQGKNYDRDTRLKGTLNILEQ